MIFTKMAKKKLKKRLDRIQNTRIMQYVLSQKGKTMIKLNGYTYASTPGRGPKIRWKCSTHQHVGCLAAVHTVEDTIVAVTGQHIHKRPDDGKNNKIFVVPLAFLTPKTETLTGVSNPSAYEPKLDHWPELIPKQPTNMKLKAFLKCRQCTKKKIRKETCYRCKGCPNKAPLCPDCFEAYHAELQLKSNQPH